jgi:hypothetical protein
MSQESVRRAIDAATISGGYLGAIAYYADVVAPILSAVMLLLSIIWLLWRMWDRYQQGPRFGDDK